MKVYEKIWFFGRKKERRVFLGWGTGKVGEMIKWEKKSLFGFEFFECRKCLIFDSPIALLFGNLEGHFIELSSQFQMPQMLMFHSDIKVGQHSHMLNFILFLLTDLRSELFPIPFDVIQTGFDSFDRLLVQRQTRKDNTLVNVCWGYGFVSVLVVFMEQCFLDLQGNLKGLERVLVLSVLFVNAGEVVKCESTQLKQLFRRSDVVPNVLVEQHVDTFWN